MVDLDMIQLLVEEIYYATCSAIERYNIRRCDDIKLEKNPGTRSWDKCVNMSIFGIAFVETYSVATK